MKKSVSSYTALSGELDDEETEVDSLTTSIEGRGRAMTRVDWYVGEGARLLLSQGRFELSSDCCQQPSV